ncbi:MAG TPA: HPr kinase/phosphatase C-terminal domain-containing protein [Bradyrhizobium sp.]|nr:HPr kinase/phosphatase C-terminal domain-containing protein [Bradyrhizobium sp.]
MSGASEASVHASAVQVGNRAVLIRGPSGAGKSRLAFEIILAGRAGQIPPSLLVGDDRVHLEARAAQLLVRPAPVLTGLIEIYGLGVRRCEFAEEAVIGLVVDLAAPDAARLPSPEALWTSIHGIKVPRIPVNRGFAALPLIAAALTTMNGDGFDAVSADCGKGISNHIRPSIAPE